MVLLAHVRFGAGTGWNPICTRRNPNLTKSRSPSDLMHETPVLYETACMCTASKSRQPACSTSPHPKSHGHFPPQVGTVWTAPAERGGGASSAEWEIRAMRGRSILQVGVTVLDETRRSSFWGDASPGGCSGAPCSKKRTVDQSEVFIELVFPGSAVVQMQSLRVSVISLSGCTRSNADREGHGFEPTPQRRQRKLPVVLGTITRKP